MDHADPELLEELLEAVRSVASRGAFTLGAEVERFEADYAAYCRARHAIGVSSGTEALILALRAVGVGPGDEVILPTNSFIATAEAVSAVGATPVLIDVDPDLQVVTSELVEAAVTPRTACVIPVHLYGRTVDLDPIVRLARDAGLRVIEDACQAHGAWYGDRRAGTIADAGCFSFYPAKNLGAWGDGGAVTTNDPEIADRIELLRSHGERPRYHHRIVGTTARLDAIQAAVLRVKLALLDDQNERRREYAAILSDRLAGSAVTPPAPAAPGTDHVYHQYVVTTDARDELRAHLDARGVASGVHYPVPIHMTGAYADLGYTEGSLPVAESLAGRICTLPVSPALSPDEIERVADAVAEFEPANAAVRI